METKQFSWLDKKEYPFESNYLNVDGNRLHYIDEGSGEVLLFVHGTPSWSFDFRNVIKPLSKHYRCVAFDHIGFGLSDKPKDYPYSIFQHTKNLGRLIEHLNLKNIHLVLHDFGGPIGVEYLLKNATNVSSVTFINSWLGSAEDDPEYQKMKKILKSPLLPILYRWFNFSPKILLPKSFGDKKLDKQLLKQYTEPFENRHQRNATLAFARSLLNDQALFEKQWQQRDKLQNMPIQLIWGMKDMFCTERYFKKFQAAFPLAETTVLPTAGHFPQEEQPAEVAKVLKSFVESCLAMA